MSNEIVEYFIVFKNNKTEDFITEDYSEFMEALITLRADKKLKTILQCYWKNYIRYHNDYEEKDCGFYSIENEIKQYKQNTF